MMLTKLRRIGAGSCLVAASALLWVSTAQAGPIPSQLAAAPDLATARWALSDALALERLGRLGFTGSEAERLVAATRAAQVDGLVSDAWRVSEVDGRLRMTMQADTLQAVTQRLGGALADQGLNEAEVVAGLERGLRRQGEGSPRAWLEGLGMAPGEAALLIETLSGAELAWLGAHPEAGTTYAGKVVGLNWKGLMLLLLPLVGIAWVAAAGSGEAAGIAAAGLVVGLIFVLFAEPAFLFGSRDDVIR